MRGYAYHLLPVDWAIRAWSHTDSTCAPHFILPHREISLVACLSGAQPEIRVFGGSACAYTYLPPPRVRHFGVALSPELSADLIGIHAHELINSGPCLPGRIARELTPTLERLDTLSDAEATRTWLNAVARVLRHDGHEPTPESVGAGLIRRHQGRISMSRLAAHLDISPRQLQRRFVERLGLTPKAYARLTRFTHATELSDAARRPDWASIAADTGYSDQAHMVREAVEMTGLSPARLYARRHAASEIFNTALT
jgi:AraC-like DNA-binding protein